ncbi:MAG TPA: cobalamin-binding protein [Anaerolineales bacterium]|nr:cobalamin-binding protein [Anaerolineales bacterium]
MNRKFRTTLVLSVIFLLSACRPAGPAATPEPVGATRAATATEAAPEPVAIVLTDGRGAEITLDAPAGRIVSLAPSNTELLFAVGAGAQVVGRDSFSDYPEAALSATDIGGGFGEIDTETLLSLDPDLVLSADIIAPEQNEALERLGLTVFVLPNPLEFADLYENVLVAGALTGRTAEAKALAADLQSRVAAVMQNVSAAETTPLVFYQLDSTDPNAPWTTGPGTFIDTLIKMAGGENLGAVLMEPWAQISAEDLIASDPDIILMGDAVWSGLTPEDVAARPGWGAITAVVTGRVYAFDDNLVSRPGPRLVDGLEALAQLFHPELFE